MKSEEGNKATFSHWPRLDTLFATQAWISLRRLPEAKASKKAVLRVRCLMSVSFMGSNGAFVSSLRTTERFHLGKFLELLGRSKPMKVCIMCNMVGRWAQSVNDCSPVTINGRGAPVQVLVQVHEKI